MAKAFLPGANRTAQYWAGRFVGSLMHPNLVCLHDTESTDWPTYSGGADAPHLTIKPNIQAKTISKRQHFPLNRSSRALVNKLGGVETNTLNVIQIEIIGTCDPDHRKTWGKLRAGVDYFYLPDAPDWFLLLLGREIAALHTLYPAIPLQDAAPRGWLPYPKSWGSAHGQRMTFHEWNNAYGVVGHQHVPENDHGDPGDLAILKIIDHARLIVGEAAKPKPTGPLTRGAEVEAAIEHVRNIKGGPVRQKAREVALKALQSIPQFRAKK